MLPPVGHTFAWKNSVTRISKRVLGASQGVAWAGAPCAATYADISERLGSHPSNWTPRESVRNSYFHMLSYAFIWFHLVSEKLSFLQECFSPLLRFPTSWGSGNASPPSCHMPQRRIPSHGQTHIYPQHPRTCLFITNSSILVHHNVSLLQRGGHRSFGASNYNVVILG